MATQLGKAHIFSLSGGTMAPVWGTTFSAWVQPNMQSLRLSHSVEVDRIKGQNGKTSALIFEDDSLECTFEFIPEASSNAGAIASASLPPAGALVVITALPCVRVGPWIDDVYGALNVNTAGSTPTNHRWIYEGGGQINGLADQKWTMTLPLRRYVGLSGAESIS